MKEGRGGNNSEEIETQTEEFELRVLMESEEKKRKLNGPTIVSAESDSQEIESKPEGSVFGEEIEAASSENGAKESESESKSSSSSDERMEESKVILW